jgi:arabinogalactan oligomer/maltooligosaccharide transport system substrate-binding protein
MRLINALALTLAIVIAMPSYAKSKLNLWEHEKDEDQKVLDEIIDAFSKANPDIEIKRSHYKTEDLRTQFQTAAMGGGGAELIIAPNDFAGPFSVMQIIKPVNGFFKPEKFYESVVAGVTDGQSNIWGLPLSNGNHLMLFVNKSLVKTSPTTIEELIEQAKKISNPEKKQFGFTYNLNEPFWFVSFMGAFGEKPLVGQQPKLDSAGMVEALELVKKFKFESRIVPPDCDYTCAETLFVEGKAGMTINGDWAVGKYRDALKDNLEIVPLPKLGKTGQFMSPMVSGKYLFLNASLKGNQLKNARKFGDFLMSPEIQEMWVKKSGRLPALKQVATSPAVTGDRYISAALKATENGQPMPMAIEMRAVWDAIRPSLQKVMAGRMEPKAAAAAMQKEAEAKIKEMKQ